MLRPSDHTDTDLVSRRSILKGGLAGLAGAAVFGTHQSYADDVRLPDNPFADSNGYPHSFSPLQEYVDQETALMKDHDVACTVIETADRIADKLKLLFHREMQLQKGIETKNADHSLRIAATQGKYLERYMHMLADQFMDEGYEYRVNADSFHDAMREKIFAGRWPLDCDLLAHIGLHIARQHNLPFFCVETMRHVGLCTKGSDKIFNLSMMQTPDFIQTISARRKEDKLSVSAGKTIGFYKPMSELMLRRNIAGNLVYATLNRLIWERKDVAAFENTCDAAEKLLKDLGPSLCLADGVACCHKFAAQAYIAEGNLPETECVQRDYHLLREKSLSEKYAYLFKAAGLGPKTKDKNPL